MAVEPIIDHVDEAISRLISQYSQKPLITGLLSAIVGPIQDIENGIQECETLTGLYTSVGVQLDGIGSIVGQPRDGLDDDTYRLFILGKIGENVSNTTVAAVVQVFSVLMNTSLVREFELYPASVALAAQTLLAGIDPSLYPVIADMLQKSLAAGVSLSYVEICDPVNPFQFDTGGGFGSDIGGQTAGGIFGDTIYNNPGA